jgi:hypothetical protein
MIDINQVFILAKVKKKNSLDLLFQPPDRQKNAPPPLERSKWKKEKEVSDNNGVWRRTEKRIVT